MALEKRALEQFDRLCRKGDLLWAENSPRLHASEPFDVSIRNHNPTPTSPSLLTRKHQIELRVAPSLRSKPVDTKQEKPKAAFADSEGDFDLGYYGPQKSHQLILNKFCVVRPQFVLPTAQYQPQSDPLNEGDFTAAWEVFSQLGDHQTQTSKFFAIFNCGVDAGSSVGHKHMQVIPKSGIKDDKNFFKLLRESEKQMCYAVPGAPFRHGALPIQNTFEEGSGKGLMIGYNYLRKSLRIKSDQAHNVLVTEDWLVVIPRSKAWIKVEDETVITCNSAGMVGMLWCWSEEQYEGFMKYGPMQALSDFGVPPE